MIEVIVGFVVIAALYFLINKNTLNNRNCISIKESMDLVNLPVVTFVIKGHKIRFILDSGADLSIINKQTAEVLELEEHSKQDFVVNISGKTEKGSKSVITSMMYMDKTFESNFLCMDLSNTMTEIKESTGVLVHGILGTDFLLKNKYIIDFEKLQCYYGN